MDEAEVEFAGVGFEVGERTLLDSISLKLKAGTTTALLGRSGSGKTTLMRTVNALVMPTAGSVKVGGRATTDWNVLELRRGIGYVIQESGLFPHWTVERNIGLALELRGGPEASFQNPESGRPGSVAARVKEVMALAGLGAELAGRYPWQLSGGQRQRVGLARALAGNPGVLLMDEPFGALDPMTRAEMQEMLLGLLKQVRKTILLVTHDLEEALFLATRVVFLDGGKVVADLASEDVARSGDAYVRKYLAAVHRAG